MVETLQGLLGGAAVFACLMLVHLAVWRAWTSGLRGVTLIAVFAVVIYAGAVGAFVLLAGRADATLFWVSVSFYAMLVMFYLHFYTGVFRSVSVRILGELVRAPSASLTPGELDRLYPQRAMIDERLRLLVNAGWLVVEGGRYRCTSKGVVLARLAALLAKPYAFDVSG